MRRGIGGSGGSHTKSEISFDTLRFESADTPILSKSNISTAFSFWIECLLALPLIPIIKTMHYASSHVNRRF